MLSPNKSKAITRIFLFFFPFPLLSPLLCLDLVYQNQYFKRKKESISCLVALFFVIVMYFVLASQGFGFYLGLPFDVLKEHLFLSLVLISSLVVAVKSRCITLFKYLELFEQD